MEFSSNFGFTGPYTANSGFNFLEPQHLQNYASTVNSEYTGFNGFNQNQHFLQYPNYPYGTEWYDPYTNYNITPQFTGFGDVNQNPLMNFGWNYNFMGLHTWEPQPYQNFDIGPSPIQSLSTQEDDESDLEEEEDEEEEKDEANESICLDAQPIVPNVLKPILTNNIKKCVPDESRNAKIIASEKARLQKMSEAERKEYYRRKRLSKWGVDPNTKELSPEDKQRIKKFNEKRVERRRIQRLKEKMILEIPDKLATVGDLEKASGINEKNAIEKVKRATYRKDRYKKISSEKRKARAQAASLDSSKDSSTPTPKIKPRVRANCKGLTQAQKNARRAELARNNRRNMSAERKQEMKEKRDLQLKRKKEKMMEELGEEFEAVEAAKIAKKNEATKRWRQNLPAERLQDYSERLKKRRIEVREAEKKKKQRKGKAGTKRNIDCGNTT
ncbi:hypothetical protein CAEBREN_13374 [Caenorhabditis brenneri]|uniref:Uncharacterized protein n=1 Tax=Caenorhabditis brenneri TaxID=135651 RepID=G0NBW1_CAEBE|nr:hypothetical protein CAEBREN_13374 [Caenorhabditis brenneri]